jgi:hypothetical protein
MEDLFKQVLNAETEDDIDALVQDYIDLVDTEQLKEVTDKLDGKFRFDFDTLIENINILFSNKEQEPPGSFNTNYYRIYENENKIKISKQENDETTEESILIRGSDGAIKIGNGNWLDSENLEKLKDFLGKLSGAGIIMSYAGIYVGQIGLLLAEIGFDIFGYMLFRFGMRMAVLGLFFSVASMVLLVIIDILENHFEEKVKAKDSKNKTYSFFSLIKNKITNNPIGHRILTRIQFFFQRISLNLG